VFLAAAEGGDAVEFKEADGGLFTTSVLAVLKGGQKADDAFRSSAARVSESAARYAVEQAPSFLGDGEVPVFAKR
jgi:hypothetical protein